MDPNSQPAQPRSPQAAQQYDKPVAYDQDGNPLYAHPPQANPHSQVVHFTRAINPVDQPIPPEVMQKYEESRRKFPSLNLSKGEYIISAVRRHPIGILQIWSVVIIMMIVFGGIFGILFLGGATDTLSTLGGDQELITGSALALLALYVLFVLGGFAATYIYNNNKFFLTNESVIQEIQTSLLARHEQTVSLINIEDASYKQTGVLQSILNYGTIRLSTEGDETTYTFSYVANPKRHIATLNNAVEAFKNGRPVAND